MKRIMAAAAVGIGLVVVSQSINDTALAQTRMYEVKVTNLTPGQSFTPILAATHNQPLQSL